MLAKCSVFIATSLDGFIAREDGSIDWLMKANSFAEPGEDCGYKSFMSTVDALIMGRHSYEKVLTFDPWPYEVPVIVMSSKKIAIPINLQGRVSSTLEAPLDLVSRLTKQGLGHLYIDGGVTIQSFLNQQLIKELTITLIPVLLGRGRSLFGPLGKDIELKLKGTSSYPGNFVQLKYQIE
jgi:dihydrofolate reductase